MVEERLSRRGRNSQSTGCGGWEVIKVSIPFKERGEKEDRTVDKKKVDIGQVVSAGGWEMLTTSHLSFLQSSEHFATLCKTLILPF